MPKRLSVWRNSTNSIKYMPTEIFFFYFVKKTTQIFFGAILESNSISEQLVDRPIDLLMVRLNFIFPQIVKKLPIDQSYVHMLGRVTPNKQSFLRGLMEKRCDAYNSFEIEIKFSYAINLQFNISHKNLYLKYQIQIWNDCN